MSYLNQAHDPRRRATAIVTVGAVHALLAVGLVTGLAVNFVRIEDGKLIGTDIPLDPPKPDPSPSPNPPEDRVAYIPPAPVPAIPRPPEPGPIYDDFDPATETPEVAWFPKSDPGPVDPPRPAPSFTPKRAEPRNAGNWIDDSDYPRRALVDGVEGSVGFRLVIGTNGRVSGCELTRPTGNRALDDATCRLITSRARFEAATDETGAKVVGTYTGSVTWEIPD